MSAVTQQPQPRSVLLDMAGRYGMEPAAFEQTLRQTVVPQDTSREQFAAFLLVAKEYNLNPITKEIYAFPTKAGGIQPIVGIDGWLKIINSHPEFDGMEFEDRVDDEGNITAITCNIYRKDRGRPVSVTEYLAECSRNTEPWKKWPARMLRHKAATQAARYAFGLTGIVDEDEAQRIIDVTPTQPAQNAPEQPSGPTNKAKQLVQERLQKQVQPERRANPDHQEPAEHAQPEINF